MFNRWKILGCIELDLFFSQKHMCVYFTLSMTKQGRNRNFKRRPISSTFGLFIELLQYYVSTWKNRLYSHSFISRYFIYFLFIFSFSKLCDISSRIFCQNSHWYEPKYMPRIYDGQNLELFFPFSFSSSITCASVGTCSLSTDYNSVHIGSMCSKKNALLAVLQHKYVQK